jgi:hypothetical protein
MGISKIQNLKHEYKTIRTHLPKKPNEAQTYIKRRPI